MAVLRIAALKAGKITPRDKAIRDWVESYRRRIKAAYPKAVFETEYVLGCTIPEFVTFIETKFQPGMTWENKSEKWLIKMLMPYTRQVESDAALFYKFYHHTNMVPAWKKPKGFIADPSGTSPLDREGNGDEV